MKDQLQQYYAKDRQAWRAWLEEHHANMPGVWLICYKQQSGKPSVSYKESVEEALCFGWIDSRLKTIDDERNIQFFSPRKPKSPWAQSNKQRIEKLTEQGLITSAGLKSVEIAKQNGAWNSYDEIEALTLPHDFAQALEANSVAHAHFMAFSSSVKKQLLWWIASAKRPETRTKRIEQVVSAAEEKRNPLNDTAKPK